MADVECNNSGIVSLEMNSLKLQKKRHEELVQLEGKIYNGISEEKTKEHITIRNPQRKLKTISLNFGGNVTNNKTILTNENIAYFSNANSVLLIDLIHQRRSKIITSFYIDRMFYIEDDVNNEYYLLFKSAGNYFYMYRITNNTFLFVKSFCIKNLFYINSFGRKGELCFITWEEDNGNYFLNFFLLKFLFEYGITNTHKGKDTVKNKEPVNIFYYFNSDYFCEFDQEQYPNELKEWYTQFKQKKNEQHDVTYFANGYNNCNTFNNDTNSNNTNNYNNTYLNRTKRGQQNHENIYNNKNNKNNNNNNNKYGYRQGIVSKNKDCVSVKLQMCEIVRMKYFYFCMVHMNKHLNKLALANNNFIVVYDILNYSYKVIYFKEYISCVKVSDENFIVVGFVNGKINIIFFDLLHIEKELLEYKKKNDAQNSKGGGGGGGSGSSFSHNEKKKVEEYKHIRKNIKPFSFNERVNTLQENFPYIANYSVEYVQHDSDEQDEEKCERFTEENASQGNPTMSPSSLTAGCKKGENENGNKEKQLHKKRKLDYKKKEKDKEDAINPVRFINFSFEKDNISYIESFSIVQYKWHSHSVYNLYLKKKQIMSTGEEGVIVLYDLLKGEMDFFSHLDGPCHDLLIKKKRNLVICQMLDNSVTFMNYNHRNPFFQFYGITIPLLYRKLFARPFSWKINVRRNVEITKTQMLGEMDYDDLTRNTPDMNNAEYHHETNREPNVMQGTWGTNSYNNNDTTNNCNTNENNNNYNNNNNNNNSYMVSSTYNEISERIETAEPESFNRNLQEDMEEEMEEEMDVIDKEEEEESKKRISIKKVQKKLEEIVYQLGRFEKSFYKSYLLQMYCDTNEGVFFSLLTDFKKIQLYNIELDKHISYVAGVDVEYKSRTDFEKVNDIELVTYGFNFDREYLFTVEKRNYLKKYTKELNEEPVVESRHTLKLWRLARNCKTNTHDNRKENNFLTHEDTYQNYHNNDMYTGGGQNRKDGKEDNNGDNRNLNGNRYNNTMMNNTSGKNKSINADADDYDYKMLFNSGAHLWFPDVQADYICDNEEGQSLQVEKELFVKVLFHPYSNMFIVLQSNGCFSVWVLGNAMKLLDTKVLPQHKAIFFYVDALENPNGVIYTQVSSIYNTGDDLGYHYHTKHEEKTYSSDSSDSSSDDFENGRHNNEGVNSGSEASVDSILVHSKKKKRKENMLHTGAVKQLGTVTDMESIDEHEKMLAVIRSVNYKGHRILSGDIAQSGEYFCLLHEQIISIWQLYSLSVHFILTHPVYTNLDNDILNAYKGVEMIYQKQESYVCLYLYDSLFIYCTRNAVLNQDMKFDGIIEYVKFDNYSCKFLAIGVTKNSKKNPNVLVQYNYIYEFNQYCLKKRKMFYSSINTPITAIEFAPLNKFRNKINYEGCYQNTEHNNVEEFEDASVLVALNAKMQLQVFYFNNMPRLMQIKASN